MATAKAAPLLIDSANEMKHAVRIAVGILAPPVIGLAVFVLSLTVVSLINEPENTIGSVMAIAFFGFFVALTKGILVSVPYMALMELWFLLSRKRRINKCFEVVYSTFLGLAAGKASTSIRPFGAFGDIMMISLGGIVGLLMGFIYLRLRKAEQGSGINSVTAPPPLHDTL